jgi:hypothetical protein
MSKVSTYIIVGIIPAIISGAIWYFIICYGIKQINKIEDNRVNIEKLKGGDQ